jgi:hypothetical protein
MFLTVLAAGLVGALVCRRWPAMALVFLPLIVWGGVQVMIEANHLHASEEISARAGVNLRHIVLFYLTIALSAVLVVVGTLLGSRRRKVTS